MFYISWLRIWNETRAALLSTGYSFFYIEVNLVCAIILGIIFNNQLNASDQTEARVFWLRLLFVQFLYCLTSILRALVDIGLIPDSPVLSYLIVSANLICMHIAAWLVFVYSEVSQESWLTGSLRNKIISAIPIIIEVLIVIISPITDASVVLRGGQIFISFLHPIMMLVAPGYFLAAVVIAVIRRTRMTRYERDMSHAAAAIYPAILFIMIMFQWLEWRIPLFCGAVIVADVYVHVKYSDSLVSIDPLTKIPNRNGMIHKLSEMVHKRAESEDKTMKDLYVFAIDVEGMSSINSAYGRLEGDKVLMMMAAALEKFSKEAHPCFVSRYYGDEFIIIAEIQDKDELELFTEHVRNYISNAAMASSLSYHLHATLGMAKYEKFSKLETVSGLIEEADRVLNEQQEQRKFQSFMNS